MTGTIENRSKFLETLFEKRGGVELPFEPYVPISDLPETHLAHLTTEELLDIAKEQASRVSANLIETSSFEMNEVIRQLIEKSGGGQVMIPSTDEFEKLGVNVISDQLVKWKIGKENRDENINANPRAVEWGSAPILVRSTRKAGKIKIHARVQFEGTQAPTPAEIEIESVPASLPFCYSEEEMPAVERNGQVVKESKKQQFTEEEKRKMLDEVDQQQREFGITK